LEREGALRQRRLGALGTVDSRRGSRGRGRRRTEEKPIKEKE
jgi:hypothetical protein